MMAWRVTFQSKVDIFCHSLFIVVWMLFYSIFLHSFSHAPDLLHIRTRLGQLDERLAIRVLDGDPARVEHITRHNRALSRFNGSDCCFVHQASHAPLLDKARQLVVHMLSVLEPLGERVKAAELAWIRILRESIISLFLLIDLMIF